MFFGSVFLFSLATNVLVGANEVPVTYGSAVILKHVDSQYKLFSDQISWSSEDAGFIVTAVKEDDTFSENFMWTVVPASRLSKARPELSPIKKSQDHESLTTNKLIGSEVKCGDIIVLEHVSTNKIMQAMSSSLHTVRDSSHIKVATSDREQTQVKISQFQVTCFKEKATTWNHNEDVGFLSLFKAKYLSTSMKYMFTSKNCPRCPIIGHLEVGLTVKHKKKDQLHVWRALESLTLERYDGDDDQEDMTTNIRDEL